MRNFILNNVKNLCTHPVTQASKDRTWDVDTEFGTPLYLYWEIDEIYHDVKYYPENHKIEYNIGTYGTNSLKFAHRGMTVKLTTEEEIQLLGLFQQVIKRYLKDTRQFIVTPYVEDKRDSLLDPLNESKE